MSGTEHKIKKKEESWTQAKSSTAVTSLITRITAGSAFHIKP